MYRQNTGISGINKAKTKTYELQQDPTANDFNTRYLFLYKKYM